MYTEKLPLRKFQMLPLYIKEVNHDRKREMLLIISCPTFPLEGDREGGDRRGKRGWDTMASYNRYRLFLQGITSSGGFPHLKIAVL